MKIQKNRKNPSFDIDIGSSESNGRRKKKGKGLAAVLAAVVAFGGIGAGVDSFTKVTVPDVQGLAAYSAEKRFTELGFDEEDLIFKCDRVLTESEIQHGEYRVIDQSLEGGERVHTDDEIVIMCEDLKAIRIDEMTDCRYDKASDAIQTAEKYQYDYQLNNLSGDDITRKYHSLSPIDQERYYVYEQTVFNDDRKVTAYIIDTEDNIVEHLETTFKNCKGDSTYDTSAIAYDLGLDVTYEYDSGQDISSESGLVVTGFDSVNLAAHEVTMSADTKEHIAEVKLLKKIKKKIPYKGLDEEYIDRTGVGEPDYESESGDTVTYTWESDDGKYDVLEVVCTDGKVSSVKKNYKKVYWRKKLPDFSADKDEYDAQQAAKKAEAEKARLAASSSSASTSDSGPLVWIPNSGHCYHSNPNCSGMKNPTQVSLSQAENWGYRACSKCY